MKRKTVLKRLARVWIILIRKGGSGKTTTAVNLAAALVYLFGRKVCLVDLDPQGNATKHVGLMRLDHGTVNTLFTEIGVDPKNVIYPASFTLARHTYQVDVMPAALDLDETDISMKATQVGLFKPVIEALAPLYDDIIIDTRPTRSYLTLSAMITATHAVIPMEAGVLALDTLAGTIQDITEVRRGLNPDLKLIGILPTRVREHTNLSRDVLVDTSNQHDSLLIRYQDQGTPKVLYVRDSTLIGEAVAYGIPGIAYRLSENIAAQDYLRVAEVLHAEKA